MPAFLETTVDKFIFKAATDRVYTAEGLWLLEEAGSRTRVGISDYQQQRNGDMAFVHLRPVGTLLRPGDEVVDIETIKATASFASPVAGRVVEINPSLQRTPELVNQDPYGEGWLAVIETESPQLDRAALIDAEGYLAVVRQQAEEELAP